MLERLRDAMRVAARAAHPTDILVIKTGFRVIARNGNLSTGRTVTFEQFELAPLNPLVEAVHVVNKAVAWGDA